MCKLWCILYKTNDNEGGEEERKKLSFNAHIITKPIPQVDKEKNDEIDDDHVFLSYKKIWEILLFLFQLYTRSLMVVKTHVGSAFWMDNG